MHSPVCGPGSASLGPRAIALHHRLEVLRGDAGHALRGVHLARRHAGIAGGLLSTDTAAGTSSLERLAALRRLHLFQKLSRPSDRPGPDAGGGLELGPAPALAFAPVTSG